jgi:hypothetical protein
MVSPLPRGRPRDPETQRVAADLVNRLDALKPGQANDVLRAVGQPQQPTDEAARRAVKQLIIVSPDSASLNNIAAAMPPQ